MTKGISRPRPFVATPQGGEGGIRTLDGRNRPYRFSRPAHSTALPPLRSGARLPDGQWGRRSARNGGVSRQTGFDRARVGRRVGRRGGDGGGSAASVGAGSAQRDTVGECGRPWPECGSPARLIRQRRSREAALSPFARPEVAGGGRRLAAAGAGHDARTDPQCSYVPMTRACSITWSSICSSRARRSRPGGRSRSSSSAYTQK